MNIFYVYLHRRKTDNKVFYVGKGKNRRAWCTDKRNKHWNNVVDKHGFNVDIVFEGLSEQEAFQIEKDTILEMKYFGCDLTNMTDGGEGSSGFKQSDEQIQKRTLPKIGVPLTEVHRQKISKAQKGVPKKRTSVEKMRKSKTGIKLSEASRLKMSQSALKSGTCTDKNTYCFFSNTDIFIGTRKELAGYTNLPLKKFTPLFGNKRVKMAKGWYVLDFQKLMIFKELIKWL